MPGADKPSTAPETKAKPRWEGQLNLSCGFVLFVSFFLFGDLQRHNTVLSAQTRLHVSKGATGAPFGLISIVY